MEIIIDVILIKDPYRFKEFTVLTNSKNYQLHRMKLELEKQKIVNFLKKFKEEGLIKSIYIPKNKRIQKDLNNLVRLKRKLDRSILKIKSFFYR